MKISPQKTISFIITFIMICASGDAMVFALHRGAMFGMVAINFGILAVWNVQKGKISRNMLMVYGAFAGLIAVSMIFNLDFAGYTQWFFAAIALLLVCDIEFKTFCRQFDVIMFWVCIFSLIGMSIYMFAPALLDGVPTVNTGVITAKNLWLTCIPLDFTVQTFRNYGIFYEPGKFAVYIGIALFIQLYGCMKPSPLYIGVYLLTLLTTRSTTGIVAVAFLVVFWLLTHQNSKMKFLLIFALFVFATYTVTLRREWILEFVMKFDTKGAASASINSRLASFWVGIWIGISHLFTGAGAVKAQSIFNELAIRYFDTACFANMITYLFASFGVLFLCLMLFGLWGVGVSVYENKVKAWGTVLFFVLLYSGQILTYSCCFYVLVFYGWDYLYKNGIVIWSKE